MAWHAIYDDTTGRLESTTAGPVPVLPAGLASKQFGDEVRRGHSWNETTLVFDVDPVPVPRTLNSVLQSIPEFVTIRALLTPDQRDTLRTAFRKFARRSGEADDL